MTPDTATAAPSSVTNPQVTSSSSTGSPNVTPTPYNTSNAPGTGSLDGLGTTLGQDFQRGQDKTVIAQNPSPYGGYTMYGKGIYYGQQPAVDQRLGSHFDVGRPSGVDNWVTQWPDVYNMWASKWTSTAPADVTWRMSTLTNLFRAGLINPTTAGPIDWYGAWENVNHFTSIMNASGNKVTPDQYLSQWAAQTGNKGSLVMGPNGVYHWAGDKQTFNSSTTDISLSDPATAKYITNNVMQALLGREATPKELAAYRTAINSYETSHPTTSSQSGTVDYLGNRNSSTTSKSGATGEGRQQTVTNPIEQGTEYKAYHQSTIFRQAMQLLGAM